MATTVRVPARVIHGGKLSKGCYKLLAVLFEENRPIRTIELAKLAGLTAASARPCLQLLEREGLAQRQLDVVPGVNHAIFTWTFVKDAT